jgi:predicted DsbA family dithiol-disulfide isomerase
MAAERGLIMKQPPIVARTRLAFQAVELARDRDRFDAMHRAIFEAIFRDGRDVGRVEVLADIAAAIDLPPDELKTALASGIHLARVIEQERQAADLGVTGVPAMFVGDDPATAEPVIGAVPYDWLLAAVERALSGESLEWRRRALKSGIPLNERGD